MVRPETVTWREWGLWLRRYELKTIHIGSSPHPLSQSIVPIRNWSVVLLFIVTKRMAWFDKFNNFIWQNDYYRHGAHGCITIRNVPENVSVLINYPSHFSKSNIEMHWRLFITRVSEVIMFSPCVFVCLSRCCPDDLTMKDWCHTNSILQVHCWGCLVVQVMFHALMTSSMTSPGHKVGQILKLTYLRQYLS